MTQCRIEMQFIVLVSLFIFGCIKHDEFVVSSIAKEGTYSYTIELPAIQGDWVLEITSENRENKPSDKSQISVSITNLGSKPVKILDQEAVAKGLDFDLRSTTVNPSENKEIFSGDSSGLSYALTSGVGPNPIEIKLTIELKEMGHVPRWNINAAPRYL